MINADETKKTRGRKPGTKIAHKLTTLQKLVIEADKLTFDDLESLKGSITELFDNKKQAEINLIKERLKKLEGK